VRRAPVKEPAQRAPEWSAPDASGAGGLRHEKAARPVWIRSRSSGPDLASSDRAHRPDPREGVGPGARTRSALPLAGARRTGCNHPRPTARWRSDRSRMGSGSVPTHFCGAARRLRSLRSAPFQIRRHAPRRMRSGPTGTAGPPEDGPPVRPGAPAKRREPLDCAAGAGRRPGVSPTAARGFEGSTRSTRSPPLRLARIPTAP